MTEVAIAALTPIVKSIMTGVGGSVVSNIFSLLSSHQEHKQTMDIEKEKRETLKVEAEIKKELGNIDLEKSRDSSSSGALVESYKSENRFLFSEKYVDVLSKNSFGRFILYILAILFGINDFLKSSIRPYMTYFISGFVVYIFVTLVSDVGFLSADSAVALLEYICYTVVLLFIVVFAWWFSDRLIEKRLLKYK